MTGARRRAPRIARASAIAIVALVALYLATINVFVGGKLLKRALNSDPDHLYVDYASASSGLPGHVHVRDLFLRGRDSNVEWSLALDEADFRANLRALARHQFLVEHITAKGMSFRVRFRREPSELTPDVVAALPHINGFTDPPLKDPVPPPPSAPGDEYRLWGVRLQDIEVTGLREVWIDEVRYTGDASLTGGFDFHPMWYLNVGPARVATANAEVSMGRDRLVTDLAGVGALTIDTMDLRAVSGAQMWRYASGAARFDGRVPSAEFARRFVPKGVEIDGGAGSVRAALAIDRGVVTSESQLDVSLEAVTVRAHDHTIEGSTALSFRADGGAALVAELSPITLTHARFEAAPLRAKRITLTSRWPTVDLTRPLEGAELSLDAPQIAIVDARIANAYLSKGGDLKVEGGAGTFGARARVNLDAPSPHGDAILALDHLRVVRGDTRLGGDVRLRAELRSTNLLRRALDLSGATFELSGLEAKDAPPGGWVTLAAPVAVLGLSPARFEAHVSARARDATTLLTLVDARPPDAITKLFVPNDETNADLDVIAGESEKGVELRGAQAGDLRARGFYVVRGANGDGAFAVAKGPVQIGVDVQGGKASVHVGDVEAWLRDRRRAAITARVRPPEKGR